MRGERRQDGAVIFDEIELLSDEMPRGAALNMAMDERLLAVAERPLLRVYRWEGRAVTFGYFEPWQPVAAAYPGLVCVRRWTGGGVVPHGDGVDWTYSLMVPRAHPFARVRAAESYQWVHEKLAEALLAIRPGARATLTGEDHAKLSRACFENPVRHDVLLDDRKIAGAAQRRSRHGLLHQGSVQCVPIPEGMGEELAGRLARRVTRVSQVNAEVLRSAEVLAAERYATAAWNQRQ